MAFVDARGAVVASSDRRGEHLPLALPAGFVDSVLAKPVSTLAISAPALSAVTSQKVLYFARAVTLTDGSRMLAVAEVQLSLLATIMTQGSGLRGLEVTLERDAGPLLASLPLDAALGDWRHERDLIAWTGVAIGLMILAVACFTHIQLHRQWLSRMEVMRSKATLDQALGSMVNGFILLDAEHRVLTWNRSFVAEGVETRAQREFLIRHGCGLCQGYLFGVPQPLESYERELDGKLSSSSPVFTPQ